MKTQILLIAMISISFQALTANNECDCTEIVQSADCKGGCTWSTSDKTCSQATVDCSSYTTQAACDDTACAWSDATSKCAAFTACADYTVASADLCPKKSMTCTAGTAGTDGKFPCKTFACSDFKNSADCNGKMPNENSMCWFSASTCSAIDGSKCSTVTVQEICTMAGCKWGTDNKCAANTCADMKSADDCTTVGLDDFSGVNICAWSGSACADATDVSALTSANCQSKTSGYYYWDGSACSECSGSSSNSYILAFIGFIVMVMF